jgi:hypothetical protein
MRETSIQAAALIPVILAAAVFFGALILNAALIRRWQGWWRAIACLPIAALIAWSIFIVVGILREPGSHNLWPFELVLWGGGALLALGLLALLKRIIAR